MAIGFSHWNGILPEFKVTETVSDFLGRNRDEQGGSSIFQNAPENLSQPLNLQGATLGVQDQRPVQGPPGPPSGYTPSTSGGGNNPTPQPTNNESRPQEDPYAQIKAEISGAWDSYLGSLGDIENNYLPTQADAQRGIATSQYDQGVDTVNSQRVSSLRDIGSNIKNAFQAGNIFLGSRGAGDSSAANQYSFAIGQQANKQKAQLNEFVNTQLNTLKSTRDQQLNSIASWLAEQQAAVKQAIASGRLSKKQDINNLSRSILDRALGAADEIKKEASNRYNALVEWSMANSSNMGELKRNIAAIPQTFGAPQVDSRGNFMVQAGYGYGDDDSKTMNQTPSWLR